MAVFFFNLFICPSCHFQFPDPSPINHERSTHEAKCRWDQGLRFPKRAHIPRKEGRRNQAGEDEIVGRREAGGQVHGNSGLLSLKRKSGRSPNVCTGPGMERGRVFLS